MKAGFFHACAISALMAISSMAYAQVELQASVQTPPPAFTDPYTVEADLARLDASLNATKSFAGRFTQYGPDGSLASGQIYLRRPGRLRIEYDAPSPLLIVSDGTTLTQLDKALETQDRVPLSSTPLDFFLKNNVNLAQDTEVVGLTKDAHTLRVTAQDGSGEVEGRVTLVFDTQTLALNEWVITDDFGGQTRIALSDLQYNEKLNPRLFILHNNNRRDRRRR